MDFPMNSNLHQALREDEAGGKGLIKLYENLGNDYLYPDPNNLVIFPDNHDMSRIFTQLHEDYDLFKMAIIYIMTMRGIPQLYYGTEILMSNKGTESHGIIRSDFPGGWQGDLVNAFTSTGLTGQQREAQQFVKKLANWRKDKKSVREGHLMHYAPRDGVYVYFRYLDDEKIMVILNKNKDPFNLDLGRFKSSIGNTISALDVISGKKMNLGDSLSLEPRSSLILELTNN
jgi:glycosidase